MTQNLNFPYSTQLVSQHVDHFKAIEKTLPVSQLCHILISYIEKLFNPVQFCQAQLQPQLRLELSGYILNIPSHLPTGEVRNDFWNEAYNSNFKTSSDIFNSKLPLQHQL